MTHLTEIPPTFFGQRGIELTPAKSTSDVDISEIQQRPPTEFSQSKWESLVDTFSNYAEANEGKGASNVLMRAAMDLMQLGCNFHQALTLLQLIPGDHSYSLEHKIAEAYAAAAANGTFNRGCTDRQLEARNEFPDDLEEIVDEEDEVLIQKGSETKPVKKSWLWLNHILFGYVTIFFGRPGNMKGLIACSLASIASRLDALWPDGSKCNGPYNVLIMSKEEDFGDSILPRLKAAGANLDHVDFANQIKRSKRSKKRSKFFTIDDPSGPTTTDHRRQLQACDSRPTTVVHQRSQYQGRDRDAGSS